MSISKKEMFKSQIERTPMMSLLSPAMGATTNFGQVNTTPNYLTPTPIQRQSRRSFTPNTRALTPPSISPINRSHLSNLDDFDLTWNTPNSFYSTVNSSKTNDDSFGMQKLNISASSSDRFPSFFTPTHLDPSTSFSLRNSNKKPTGGAISK